MAPGASNQSLRRLWYGRAVRVAYFTKRKKRTGTPEAIEHALRRAGHEVLAVHEAKRARWLGGRLGRRATRRVVRRFGPELALIHNEDISAEVFAAIAGQVQVDMPDGVVE